MDRLLAQVCGFLDDRNGLLRIGSAFDGKTQLFWEKSIVVLGTRNRPLKRLEEVWHFDPADEPLYGRLYAQRGAVDK
jgi:hypothetical protein